MKRINRLSILVLMMFVVAACGSATSAATQAPATDVQPEQPAASGNGTEVDITLADNTIDASQTEFQVGVPYTFVITNSGRHAHNFNINPPVSVSGSLDAALNSALLSVPQGQLGVGAKVTVEYIFPDTAAGQLLEFSCLIRRHYDDGMKLEITVAN
jgi:uncharacterized cupredoxin-like copper-binding protein